jgi:hypothetical protein
MASNVPASQFRVAGSKFTVFYWDGKLIAHCNQLAHTSPAPVADAVAIQPLDARRPLAVITPNAIGMGTLVLEIVELYGLSVWEELQSLATAIKGKAANGNSPITSGNNDQNNATDLADIFNAVSAYTQPIQVTKYVYPPAGSNQGQYQENYFNCVISNYQDGETVSIGTMQIYKQITVNYTHYKRTSS